MNQKPPHPVFRLIASGLLSVTLLYIWRPNADPRWAIVIGGIAAAAVVLLIPVLWGGDSGHKMLAGILLFVPCYFLVVAAFEVASHL